MRENGMPLHVEAQRRRARPHCAQHVASAGYDRSLATLPANTRREHNEVKLVCHCLIQVCKAVVAFSANHCSRKSEVEWAPKRLGNDVLDVIIGREARAPDAATAQHEWLTLELSRAERRRLERMVRVHHKDSEMH